MRSLVLSGGLIAGALIAVSCSDRAAPAAPEEAAIEARVAATSSSRTFFAPLRMDVEVPIPTPPSGPPPTGAAGFRVAPDGQSVEFQLMLARINNLLMAHIHLGPPGEAGPVVVWLYPSGPPPVLIPGEFNGILSEGVFTAANLVGPLAGQPLSALLDAIRSGNAYVNVHTQLNPPGEVRGQIFHIHPPDPPVQ